MSEDDKKHLFEKIKNDYCLEEKNGMLRDDISLKIRELLEMSHTWFVKVKEENTLAELDLDPALTTAFADVLEEQFEIKEIEFSVIMEWSTVKDIVNYIEEALENRDG